MIQSFIYQIFVEDPLCAGTSLDTTDVVENKGKSLLTCGFPSNGEGAHHQTHVKKK